MKQIVITFLVLFLVPVVAFAAEDLAIASVVARTNPPPDKKHCDTDLGYVLATGRSADEAWSAADKKATAEYQRKARHFSHRDNYDNRKKRSRGRHVVVLVATEQKGDCAVKMIGVGFGGDEAQAREDAKEALWKRWHRWDPSKPPATVERSESL